MDNQPNDMKRSADAAEAPYSNKKKSRTGNNGSPLDASGFIATAVVQFLGVRSLVSFGATSKSNKAVVDEEVGRRKAEIARIEMEIKLLMGSDHGEAMRKEDGDFYCVDDLLSSVPITRSNMEKALKLSDCALRMIDDEIDFQRKLGTREMRWENYWGQSMEWTEHDIFLDERKKFVDKVRKPFGSLVMLPECFYCPPGGDSSKPSDEYIKWAHEKVSWISLVDGDQMGIVYEQGTLDPNWDRLDYEQPFRKFHLSGAGFFNGCMEETARNLAGRGTADNRMRIEAFRIAARKRVFTEPGLVRDSLWYTLSKMDEYLERIENAAREEGSI